MFLSITDSGMNSHIKCTGSTLLLHMCIDVTHPCTRCFRDLELFVALSVSHDTFILVSGGFVIYYGTLNSRCF